MSPRSGHVQSDEIASSPSLERVGKPDVASTDSTISIVSPDEETPAIQPQPKPQPRAKVLFLDGIRGAAALLVVCHHLGYLNGKNLGGVAVHTFFVLSAFLLTMLLEIKVEALYVERASPRRWVLAFADYAIRRVLRVYPLVIAIGIVLAFSTNAHRYQWYDFKIKLYHYNFFKLLVFAEGHHFYVFWTLPLELTYYLLIPVFVGVTVRLRRWWWVPLLPLMGWIIHSGLYVYVTAGSSFGRHLPEFVAGSIGAVVYNRLSRWLKKRGPLQTWHRLVIRTLELLVVTVLVSVIFDAMIFRWLGPYPFQVKGSDHFVCVYVVVLIVCEMLAPGPISAFFEWSLLRYAGKISFSIYLLHPRIIFSDFIRSQDDYYTKYFTVWVLVFFWGTVSYHLVEYPSQWLAGFVGRKIKALDVKEKAKATQYEQIRRSLDRDTITD